MKNKCMIGLQSQNILLIFGTTIVLLVLTSSQMQMVSASVEGSAPGSNTSNSNQGAVEGCDPARGYCGPDDQQNNADITCKEYPPLCNAGQSQGGSQGTVPDSSSSSGTSSNANQQAINHINQAQSSLQNGDTEGAQMHMDLAKKALTPCNPGDPHC
jgi:hypothetical protein